MTTKDLGMRFVELGEPAPPVECIELACEMMRAPGAPLFDSNRESLDATVELARALARSSRATP